MEAVIYNHRYWIKETNPQKLKERFENYLKDSNFLVLNFMEHHFKPYGYTAIWLLAESHLAIHTFPEENKTYIELSSCDEEKYYLFLEKAKESNIIASLKD